MILLASIVGLLAGAGGFLAGILAMAWQVRTL